jgi:hypothetical protein
LHVTRSRRSLKLNVCKAGLKDFGSSLSKADQPRIRKGTLGRGSFLCAAAEIFSRGSGGWMCTGPQVGFEELKSLSKLLHLEAAVISPAQMERPPNSSRPGRWKLKSHVPFRTTGRREGIPVLFLFLFYRVEPRLGAVSSLPASPQIPPNPLTVARMHFHTHKSGCVT